MLKPYKVLRNPEFIGREDERAALLEVNSRPDPSIVVVYGRRRVGKTELLEQVYRDRKLLKFEGLEGGNPARQMEHALYQLARYAADSAIERLRFTRWLEFFDYLARFVGQGVWTLYLEELQWLASYQGDFVSELKHAWDNTLRRNPKLVLVLCGSAPSFVVGTVLRSQALYGRVFKEIQLRPKTEKHDLETKLRHARRFLEGGHKVLVSLIFRGRELRYIDDNTEVLDRFAVELESIAKVERSAKRESRNRVCMILGPK